MTATNIIDGKAFAIPRWRASGHACCAAQIGTRLHPGAESVGPMTIACLLASSPVALCRVQAGTEALTAGWHKS